MFKIKLDIINANVYVFTGNDEWKGFVKESEIKEDEIDKTEVYGFTVGDTVWFKEKKPSINTIIHESHHLKHEILKARGIEDEEMSAYMIAYIAEQIIKKTGVK